MAEGTGKQSLEQSICDSKETKNEQANPCNTEKTNKQDSLETGKTTELKNASAKVDTASKFCETKRPSEQENESCKTQETEDKPGSSYKMEEAAASTQEHISHFEQVLIKPDIYDRKAKEQGWMSRSCFTLLQIDERFKIFEGVTRAVDLFASPGIWTQVLSRRLFMGETVYINDNPRLFYNELALHQKLGREKKPVYKTNEDVVIVALDSYGIPPYPGVIQIDGDIMQYCTSELILNQFDGNKVDLIVCSKKFMPTELHCLDVIFQANHMTNVLYTTCNILKQGGTLVMTILKETHNNLLKTQLFSLFKEVDIFRPKSCKISTKELFAICRYYSPPEGFDPKLMGPFLDFFNKDYSSLTGVNRILIPFLTCGDTTAYPLSPEDEEMYKRKFTVPFSMDMPSSSRTRFKSNDLYQYMEKMNEAIKSIGLESNPDLAEMEMIKKKCEDSSTEKSGENIVYDNGPLYDLIQKTTKIKKKPYESEPENVPIECGFQFLYEDKLTDPEQITASSEHELKEINSTCTCHNFP